MTVMHILSGMGMIAASLLLIMEEEDSFWMMVAIIEDFLPPSYYSPSLIGKRIPFSSKYFGCSQIILLHSSRIQFPLSSIFTIFWNSFAGWSPFVHYFLVWMRIAQERSCTLNPGYEVSGPALYIFVPRCFFVFLCTKRCRQNIPSREYTKARVVIPEKFCVGSA